MADVYLILKVLSTLAILHWTWKVIVWAWLKPRRLQKHLRKQGFIGAPYKFLYGDIQKIMRSYTEANSKPNELSHVIMPRVLPFLHQTIEKYGKMGIQWYGPSPRVHITQADHVKDFMITHFRDVTKPYANPFQPMFVNGLVMLGGKKWVKHRKIVHAAFNAEKVKIMLPAFQKSCSELISKWEKSFISKDSIELDVWPDLHHLTGIVISRTAFGTDYEEGHKIFSLQSEQAVHFMDSTRSLYIPGSRFLPTKRNKRMKEINREVRAIVRGIIRKRESSMRLGELPNNDLLGMLMESMQGNGQSEDAERISMDDIVDECKLFYFAGQESGSVLILWTMVLLSMHQEWQKKAREEVLQVFGKRIPNYEEINNLKIVTMILNEVLRLYPPLATLIRITQKDIKLGEISLPAGVQVELPVLMVQRDHELWGEDADEFNPQRFSEGVPKAAKNQLAYLPFGWGPRICVGQHYAMVEVKLAISMILQAFSFELSANYLHAPYCVITVLPQHGAQLILHKL